jgi:hypothetical protein
MSEKIKLSEWRGMSLPKRTEIYFSKSTSLSTDKKKRRLSLAAQTAFWNDWQKAFQAFEAHWCY